uniref:Uncharacterized protein n=1 Tax=Oryza meridionalis TaxID=40149 RepID=A0A0E0DC76_9ORYZ
MTALVGAVSLLGGVVMAFFHIPHKSPATFGNDDMLQSLPRSFGAGRVKEVAPRWLGSCPLLDVGAVFRYGDFRGFSVAAVVKSALLGRLGG